MQKIRKILHRISEKRGKFSISGPNFSKNFVRCPPLIFDWTKSIMLKIRKIEHSDPEKNAKLSIPSPKSGNLGYF
mgnify:CR=1 FL=1